MKEVYNNIYVGATEDYEALLTAHAGSLGEWAFIIAARDPYHRREVGWTGRGCPKDNPEYLYAYRDNPCRIVLNMLDGKSAEWIPDLLVGAALIFAKSYYREGRKLLFVCNQGHSRGPGLALAFLRRYCWQEDLLQMGYVESKAMFTKTNYPDFLPGTGVDQWLAQHWEEL